MQIETQEIISIIIEDIEQYQNELKNREDFKALSSKYQKGVLDGMTLITSRLKGVMKGSVDNEM